ncbi:Acyl carrier protein [Lactobacillus kimbladii]|uniref:Acyl carrier protein n=2 Tax=Lactobacillus TaxID=1578 RepID=A0A0F4L7B3_9LACO|nr:MULTISPECIES: acyl carrier protein [Lactobacillus]AIS09736.1 Acyl carrier protein [Lactobacillus sp. wkB8]AWM75849.1 acyl carrier protein [Lactobacillus kullabergensis]KJY54520.1 Acyl carrier protein [Lactobacillus kullabergensis]KJY57327.1 Acyl carrier protein [Lactobacillus kimbladii]MBC6341617.1 acyl carrier protein [Lactobacillus kimbladii]
MTEEEIFNKVKEIIVAQTGEDESAVTAQSNIKDDLNADSLDVFEVINELEDEFDIKIESEEGIETVQDLVDFVKKQLAAKEG